MLRPIGSDGVVRDPAAPASSDIVPRDRVVWDFLGDDLRSVVPEVVPAVRLRPLLDPVPARVTVWGTNPPVRTSNVRELRHEWAGGMVRHEATLVQCRVQCLCGATSGSSRCARLCVRGGGVGALRRHWPQRGFRLGAFVPPTGDRWTQVSA